MFFKRVVGLLALAFGLIGVIACVAGIYGVCILGSRLQHANDVAFAVVDKGLASAEERVRELQNRVEESRLTTTEVKHRLKDWGIREAKERVTARLEIKSRSEKLAEHLHTADLFLETSVASIHLLQQLLDVGKSFGATADAAALGSVLENVEQARGRLHQARQTVDQIHAFASRIDSEPEDSRLARVTKAVGRMLLTVSEVDTHLENAVTRLAEIRADAQQKKATISEYILLGTIAACVLLAWIAAGQGALCWCGVTGAFQRRAGPD